MKVMLLSVVLSVYLLGSNDTKDVDVIKAEFISLNDTTSELTQKYLSFECAINPEKVQRLALREKKSEKVLAQFNIVSQEDGHYIEGLGSYRKIYDGRFKYLIPVSERISLKNLNLIYFIENQEKKLRL